MSTLSTRWFLAVAVVTLVGTAVIVRRPTGSAGTSRSPVAARVMRGGELVAAIRNDPPTFNRYAPRGADSTVEALTYLLHAPLVRVNRQTNELEMWLAERATASPDHLSYTLTLRDGIRWSDGSPFSSDDVIFSLRAAYDSRLMSPLSSSLLVDGKPVVPSAPDSRTVVIAFPAPFGPGLRLLDNLPIYPKHKLEGALRAGAMAAAWSVSANPTDVVGLGPFRLASYTPAENVVVERNPFYFRRELERTDTATDSLPYLERLTVAIVRDQNTEVLRLQHGQIDISAREIRAEDYSTLRRAQERGAVKLVDAGIGVDPNMLWFNLSAKAYPNDPRKVWLQSEQLRKAISHAIDRRAIVEQVYLGLGVPVYGPVTPGNREWYVDELPRYDYDLDKARTLLHDVLRFTDSNRDGMLEDAAGRPVRFSILTQQQDTIRTRSVTVIQEQLRRVGIAVDVVGLDPQSLIQRFMESDYDAIYFGAETSALDPAMNMDFWLTSGSFHVWNPEQRVPATEWEARIDQLMQRVMGSADVAERKRAFTDAQRVFAEHVPILYFAVPRLLVAVTPRVANATPSPLKPPILWNPERLGVSAP